MRLQAIERSAREKYDCVWPDFLARICEGESFCRRPADGQCTRSSNNTHVRFHDYWPTSAVEDTQQQAHIHIDTQSREENALSLYIVPLGLFCCSKKRGGPFRVWNKQGRFLGVEFGSSGGDPGINDRSFLNFVLFFFSLFSTSSAAGRSNALYNIFHRREYSLLLWWCRGLVCMRRPKRPFGNIVLCVG